MNIDMGNCNSAPRGGAMPMSADAQIIKNLCPKTALKEFCKEQGISMSNFDPAQLAWYYTVCKRESDRQLKALAELEALEHT